MKIFGNNERPYFSEFEKENGILCGQNDILTTSEAFTSRYTGVNASNSFFEVTGDEIVSCKPRAYLHIPDGTWSKFTGFLRKTFLFWRWQTVYLDRENGSPKQQILISTSLSRGDLPSKMEFLIGKSLFETYLIDTDSYDEIYPYEFLKVHQDLLNFEVPVMIECKHPLDGSAYKGKSTNGNYYSPIYRARGLFSLLKYYALKYFSKDWKEVCLRPNGSPDGLEEKILIKKADEETLRKSLSFTITA